MTTNPPSSDSSPRRERGGRAVHGLTRLKRANLTQLLRLIHYGGELSRSQLAEEAHITRSSVLGLVAELEERGLVEQVNGAATGEVGRPSMLVRADDAVVAFTVAPLYDSIVVGTVGFSGRVLHRSTRILQRLPAPEEFTLAAAELVAQHTALLAPGTRIAGVGVAIPGHVRTTEGVVDSAYSLAWSDVRLAEMLAGRTGLPVWLDNDGSLASLAEHRFGAGRGLQNMILLFGAVGGIGGGIIVDGNLVRGRDGYAGELGHVPLSDDERAGYAGIPGSLDSMVNRLELLDVLGLARADDATLAAAIDKRADEPALAEVLDRQADYLGRAIGLFINMFNPEAVVLTGFLRTIFDVRRGRVMASVRRDSLELLADRCEVLLDTLGSDIISIGAAELPFGHLIDDPLGHPISTVAAADPVIR
ncbi:MAG: ROK family transcriptional regulator [Protaetiibacter sp.]